ncbi:hypothetical protein E2C01_094000 [Portunus trituberculatus]|uniref:Uncharacterized protein n=1 Tax=Portunus trituberculatus TaxID=210409 RepID=A0A5B7JVS8_PORTR|nr:hypothetical protein [Portunus trituberculatus]
MRAETADVRRVAGPQPAGEAAHPATKNPVRMSRRSICVVDKVVSVRSGRRPRVDSNPTTYRFEAMSFVEWFKVTYMSP